MKKNARESRTVLRARKKLQRILKENENLLDEKSRKQCESRLHALARRGAANRVQTDSVIAEESEEVKLLAKELEGVL